MHEPLSISKHWPQVQAISFDLDDTFWPILPVIENAERQLWQWLNQHYPKVTATHDLLSLREHRVKTAELFPQLAHDLSGLRLQSLECLLTEFNYAHDLNHAKTQAQTGWQLFYDARHQITWFSDAKPMLARLQPHYQLAATTNGNADLDLLGAAHHFSAIIRAGEVGHAKPDAPIWHALFDALQLLPEQILHIGDHLDHDVFGAVDNGLPAIWLDRSEVELGNTKPLPHDRANYVRISTLDQLLP